MTRSQRINRIIYEGDRYDLSAVAAGWILDRVMKKRLRTELITRLIRAVLILALVILAVVMGACEEKPEPTRMDVDQAIEMARVLYNRGYLQGGITAKEQCLGDITDTKASWKRDSLEVEIILQSFK